MKVTCQIATGERRVYSDVKGVYYVSTGDDGTVVLRLDHDEIHVHEFTVSED